jgi:hypothetical protein
MEKTSGQNQKYLDKLVEKCVKHVSPAIKDKDQVSFLTTLTIWCLTNLAINLTEKKFEDLLKFILLSVGENKVVHEMEND